jgi:hypothetical protein
MKKQQQESRFLEVGKAEEVPVWEMNETYAIQVEDNRIKMSLKKLLLLLLLVWLPSQILKFYQVLGIGNGGLMTDMEIVLYVNVRT